MTHRPTVIYIAGSGRSGSTLVERLIGGVDGYTNVGELIDLFRRVHAGDELCGCGEPFSQCPFWREVGMRMWPEGWTTSNVRQIANLQSSVARQRYIPHQLAGPLATAGFRQSAAEYRRIYVKLYSAIQSASGARAIVDASKWPAQALAVAGPDLDLRVIHLVRDVRGVAASLSRTDITRPHARSGSDTMYSQQPYTAAARWVACQAEVELVRLRATVTRVRYEDLVAEPPQTLLRTLQDLGLEVNASDLSHVHTSSASLTASHGLSGNPSRFEAGTVPLRLDEKWRSSMPRRQQKILGPLVGVYRRKSTIEEKT